ncbi:hypothetical protein, partial [Parasphingorhabdus sp.]|uniref:hypothetical protein n=1 Tax=Parasphingorhabdus sp. TaxID=2709688 RepID=UPI0030B75558
MSYFPYLAVKTILTLGIIEKHRKPVFYPFSKMIPKAILHRSKMVARRRASVGGIAGFLAIKRTIS